MLNSIYQYLWYIFHKNIITVKYIIDCLNFSNTMYIKLCHFQMQYTKSYICCKNFCILPFQFSVHKFSLQNWFLRTWPVELKCQNWNLKMIFLQMYFQYFWPDNYEWLDFCNKRLYCHPAVSLSCNFQIYLYNIF